MSRVNLESIDHNLEGGNMSGIVPQLIYGYLEDVAVWPTEPAPTVALGVTTPLTLAAAGALVGDVVMKAGTRAFTLDFTEDTGLFKINVVGENDGGHFEYDLTIIKAKIRKIILGFQNASVDRKMFFIVTDENSQTYLMGSKTRGCGLQTGGDGNTTGTTGSDRNQSSLSYKFRTRRALVYEGDTEDLLTLVPVS